LGSKRNSGLFSGLNGPKSVLQQFDKALNRDLPISRLVAMTLGDNTQYAFLVNPRFQTGHNLMLMPLRKAWRIGHIKQKRCTTAYFIDILAAWFAATGKAKRYVVLFYRYFIIDVDLNC